MSVKIIISGITGFVGRNLNKYLKENFQVQGVSRAGFNNHFSYKEINVSSLNNYNCFIHLAGKAHDLKKTSKEEEYFDVNTELTKKIFNTFLKSSCEVFIYMSSVKAVADEVVHTLDEEFVPNPITAYGRSKLEAEKYIISKKIPENKRVYILRPCMIHGPNNKGNLNLLHSFVSKGIPYPFGKYKNQRSFVSVENLCFIINEILSNKKIPSGTYHIADDTTLSTKELVEIIGKVLDKPVKILNIPKSIVGVISRIGDVLPILINTERVQKLTENYCVSNQKIKDAIGKELPLSAKEGIKKTIRSF